MKTVRLLLAVLAVGLTTLLALRSAFPLRQSAKAARASIRETQVRNGSALTSGGPLKGDAATHRLKETGQYESLVQALQAARYAVEPLPAESGSESEAAHYAHNPAQALRCWFGAEGLELRGAVANQSPWKLKVRLQGYGREQLVQAEVDGATARQNRVDLSRGGGGVVEWYENKAVGLEQGFTVQRAPPGDGPLRLILQAEGDLRPKLETEEPLGARGASSARTPFSSVADMAVRAPADCAETGTAVTFLSADGHAVLRYGGLKVWDAARRELPAHLELKSRELALVVDDQNAAYPVTVDPLFTTQEAKLTAGDGAAFDHFGYAVSLSADGNTALVGAPGDDTPAGADAGSAYVFARSGSSWTQQAQLTAGDGAAWDGFGSRVNLSGDGNTALVGADFGDTPAGAGAGSAYVFARSGSSWNEQAKLTAGDGAAEDCFGNAVSLSGDGNTALVGAEYGDTPAGTNAGSAYVFGRSGSSWSQQAKLTAGDGAVGLAVSLSGDGNTALVGAPEDETPAGANAGSAYVFGRSGSSWSQQAKLTAGDGAAGDCFGLAVNLSGDGNTALVGARWHDTPAGADAGSAYVFRLEQALDIGLRVFDGQNVIRIACNPPGSVGRYSPLRIAKNGTNYGIVLAETNAPEASKVQVKTSSGIKAWMKLE